MQRHRRDSLAFARLMLDKHTTQVTGSRVITWLKRSRPCIMSHYTKILTSAKKHQQALLALTASMTCLGVAYYGVTSYIDVHYIRPLADLNQRHQRTLADMAALRDRSTRALADARQTAEASKVETEAAREELKTLNERLEATASQLERRRVVLETALEEKREIEEANDELDVELATLRLRLDALQTDYQNLEKEHHELQKRHDKLVTKYLKREPVVRTQQASPPVTPKAQGTSLRDRLDRKKPFNPPQDWKAVSTTSPPLSVFKHIEIHKAVVRFRREHDSDFDVAESALMAEANYWMAKKAVPLAWLDEDIPEEVSQQFLERKGPSRNKGKGRVENTRIPPLHEGADSSHLDGDCPRPYLSALFGSVDVTAPVDVSFDDNGLATTASTKAVIIRQPKPARATPPPPVMNPPFRAPSIREIQAAELRSKELEAVCTKETLDKVAKAAAARKGHGEPSSVPEAAQDQREGGMTASDT